MTEQHILDQLERVVEKEYIFGVRHHSPACAHAVVQAAEALQPEAIAVEMPADTKPMLPWIVHDDTKAPIALAVAAENTQLGFYPFADFSPELAIMRWAHRNNVPIHLIDLPVGAPPPTDPDEPAAADSVATDADLQPSVDVDKPSPSAPAGKTFAGPPSPSEWAPAWPNRALTPTMHAGKHTCGRGLPNWGRKPWW